MVTKSQLAKIEEKLNERSLAWVIRAGVSGAADDLFLSGAIALANSGLGDLRQLEESRIAFSREYVEGNAGLTMREAGGRAGKYFRFLTEIQSKDVVIFPQTSSKDFFFGQVSGDYHYANDKESGFRHQRKVKWLFRVSKSEFSVAVQRELGAARTFFSFTRNLRNLIQELQNVEIEGAKT